MSEYVEFPGFDPDGDEVTSREVVEHNPVTSERSIARRIALQALYEIDSANHSIAQVLEHHINFSDEAYRNRKHIDELVRGVMDTRDEMDYVLQLFAPDFPINQVATIDRNILRIALYEIGIQKRVPLAVAIDEAVTLAQVFGSDTSARFVNGVLGAIANNLDDVRSELDQSINDDGVDVTPQPQDSTEE